MNKEIEIKYKTIQVPVEIKVDGKIYPNHEHNFKVVKEYEETKNEKVLENLADFCLEF